MSFSKLNCVLYSTKVMFTLGQRTWTRVSPTLMSVGGSVYGSHRMGELLPLCVPWRLSPCRPTQTNAEGNNGRQTAEKGARLEAVANSQRTCTVLCQQNQYKFPSCFSANVFSIDLEETLLRVEKLAHSPDPFSPWSVCWDCQQRPN